MGLRRARLGLVLGSGQYEEMKEVVVVGCRCIGVLFKCEFFQQEVIAAGSHE